MVIGFWNVSFRIEKLSIMNVIHFLRNFSDCTVSLQFSSLGSLDEKWLAELTSSMSSGFSEDKTPLGLGQPRIIWPTVEDVRCSLEVLLSRSFRQIF